MSATIENNRDRGERKQQKLKRNYSKRSPLSLLSTNSLKNQDRKHQRTCSDVKTNLSIQPKNLSLTWPEQDSSHLESWSILNESSANIERSLTSCQGEVEYSIGKSMGNSLKSLESSIGEDSLPVKKKNVGENITTRRRRANNTPKALYSSVDDNTTLSSFKSYSTYKSIACKAYLFQYPETTDDCITQCSRHMIFFFEKAIKLKQSHQYQLSLKNPNFLSLEDVILPSVIQTELDKLKQCQSKAQRSSDLISLNSVSIIQSCRIFIVQCGNEALKSIKQSRLLRESILERDRQQKQFERKQQRKLVREQRRKQRFLERKKMYPKNISLFREIAFLLTELGRLEKEEKGWQDAKTMLLSSRKELTRDEDNTTSKETDKVEEVKEENTKYKTVHGKSLNVIQTLVNDITVSCNVINSALQQATVTMEQSEDVKKDLFQKYRKDLQFHGYYNQSNFASEEGCSDPETLFRSLCY